MKKMVILIPPVSMDEQSIGEQYIETLQQIEDLTTGFLNIVKNTYE